MSGGGGARRPINGGGFITLPRPFPLNTPGTNFPRPRARPIRLFNTRKSKQICFHKMADRRSSLASVGVFVYHRSSSILCTTAIKSQITLLASSDW
jgi:hypothetical protein